MALEEALNIVETLLQPQVLSNIQALIFRQCWEGQTYAEIAANRGYDTDYIKSVGCQLWQSLSQVSGKKVTKSNICSILRHNKQNSVVATTSYTSDSNRNNTRSEYEELSIYEKSTTDFNAVAQVATNKHPGWTEAVDISVFYDRSSELLTLKQWIIRDRCRLVALLGMGGIGKTTLAAVLGKQIQTEFDHLIWRSLRNAPPVEDFLADLIQFLSNQQETELPKTLDAKIAQLMDYLRSSRCLLVLGNAESILQNGDCSGRYREGYEGYGQMLRQIAETHHQSCVVLTSREKPIGLCFKEGKTLPVRSLQLAGLSEGYAQKLLQVNGILGSLDQMRSLTQRYLGNPLVLKMVATTAQDLFDGDISEFLAMETTVFGDLRHLLDQQFNRLSELEKRIVYCLGMNREPVSLSQLQEKLVPLISKASLLEALLSLERRSLLQNNTSRFSVPSLLAEYLTEINLGTVAVDDKIPVLLPLYAQAV